MERPSAAGEGSSNLVTRGPASFGSSGREKGATGVACGFRGSQRLVGVVLPVAGDGGIRRSSEIQFLISNRV
jgi:hypothetical protein